MDYETVVGDCPKGCGRNTKYEIDGPLVWQSCSCGYRKLVKSKNSDGIVTTHVTPEADITMPKVGTKLGLCLASLADNGTSTTGVVSRDVSLTPADTATQLTILSCRGLVEKVEENKGVHGGSTWKLSRAAEKRYNI